MDEKQRKLYTLDVWNGIYTVGIYEFFFFFCYLKVENGLAELAFLKNKGHIIIDTCIQREGSEFCKVIAFPSYRTTNLLNIRMISGLKNLIDQVS